MIKGDTYNFSGLNIAKLLNLKENSTFSGLTNVVLVIFSV
jgi:hypothetical protein